MGSPFPHHATLLHHVAANGIEVERQLQSPPNAPEIMRLLLEFLLGRQPDLSVTEPFFGATARGAAQHQGYTKIAALIVAR